MKTTDRNEDLGVGVDADACRRQLAALYAAELAAAYEDARLKYEAPVLLIVEVGDSLGKRMVDNWLPRPQRWLRRIRAVESGAFRSEYQLFAKDYESVLRLLEDCGAERRLTEPRTNHLCVVVIAFEGVSFCNVSLED